MKPAAVACLAVLLLFASAANGQKVDSAGFGSKNTFSAFVEYSNDSTHIVLGKTPDRKFAGLGIQYERRLLSNHNLNLRYAAEFRPLILERDITATETFIETIGPFTATFSDPPAGVIQCKPGVAVSLVLTVQTTCSHRWSYAQGFSPLGTRLNLLPRHRLQPTSSLLVGYLLSSNKIPVDTAGSFNFTFEAGAGLEYFLSQNRSMRFEYQIQHFSNAYTAQTNPGVDSGLFKFTCTFGR